MKKEQKTPINGIDEDHFIEKGNLGEQHKIHLKNLIEDVVKEFLNQMHIINVFPPSAITKTMDGISPNAMKKFYKKNKGYLSLVTEDMQLKKDNIPISIKGIIFKDCHAEVVFLDGNTPKTIIIETKN